MRLSNQEAHLDSFEHDVNLSATTKLENVRFVSKILQNLGKDDPKYRQLRCQNSKIAGLMSYAPIQNYLTQVVGFSQVPVDGELYWKCAIVPDALPALRASVQSRLDRLQAAVGGSTTMTTLSEKQKARKLLEQKEQLQKRETEKARKRTIQQIANDKHVRENDPNWKPSVSAAAAKAGDSMQTFRDKFGE